MSDSGEPIRSVTDYDPRGLQLHQRLIDGDVSAVTQLWEQYCPRLIDAARRKLFEPTPDNEDIANEIAYKAIEAITERPQRFDPTRGKSLMGYLRMDVEGDVLNHIDSRKRRQRPLSLDRPLSTGDDVGNETLSGNLPSDDPDPQAVLEMSEGELRVERIRREAAHTEEEQIVFDLQWRDGERSTAVFADALGISDLSPADQAGHVQKIKDRIQKRLRRMQGDDL